MIDSAAYYLGKADELLKAADKLLDFTMPNTELVNSITALADIHIHMAHAVININPHQEV